MNKRTKKNVQPEQKLNNEPNADKKQVSPAIGNTNVIGSQSPPMLLDDAIAALSSKETIVDLKTFLDFIIFCSKNVDGFYEWFGEKYKSKDFSIVGRIEDFFYVDLGQIRVLYSLMSSNNKVVSPPSESKTTVT